MTISKKDPTTKTKLPPSPSIFQRGNHDYPFVGGYGGHWGEYDIVTHPDENADVSTAAVEKLDIHDGYHVKEKTQDGKSVEHQLNPGHNFKYTSGGHSHNRDGHSDQAIGGNENRNIGVDRGCATANDGYDGHGGAITSGTGGSGSFENHTGGTKYSTTKGDIVTQHDGNVHTNNKGDTVAAHTGNKYDIISKDYGINVQGGNFDIRTNGGKTQIYSGSDIIINSNAKLNASSASDMTINSGGKLNQSANSDMTIKSGSKITFQVGGSSIVIQDGKIAFNASDIEFNS